MKNKKRKKKKRATVLLNIPTSAVHTNHGRYALKMSSFVEKYLLLDPLSNVLLL